LTPNEESHARREVMAMSQGLAESEAEFSHRFEEAVVRAWGSEVMNLTTNVGKMMISKYVEALSNGTTRWHVTLMAPESLRDAIELAVTCGRALLASARDLAGVAAFDVQPKRVSASQGDDIGLRKMVEKISSAVAEVKNKVSNLDKRLEGFSFTVQALQKRVGIVQSPIQNQPRIVKGRVDGYRPPMNTPPGYRPVVGPRGPCFGCGGPHFIRDCRNIRQSPAGNFRQPRPVGASGNGMPPQI